MAVLAEQRHIKLVNISPHHIVDGNEKLTLALVWCIILDWQVRILFFPLVFFLHMNHSFFAMIAMSVEELSDKQTNIVYSLTLPFCHLPFTISVNVGV